MFKCDRCKRSYGPREKPHRVIMEERDKIYSYRKYANRPDQYGDRTDDRGGQGREIAKEMILCEVCSG